MFWLALPLVAAAVFGLMGKLRWFLAIFAGATLILAGIGLYDYDTTVLPNFETGGGGDGTGIGFAFAGAFLAVTWLATLLCFCFCLMINKLLRLLDWL